MTQLERIKELELDKMIAEFKGTLIVPFSNFNSKLVGSVKNWIKELLRIYGKKENIPQKTLCCGSKSKDDKFKVKAVV